MTAGQDVRTLEPGQAVEREIAGGEAHTYQITLQTGEFVRFRLEQRALDSSLILTAPDGKQIAEVNLNDAGESESLALEALLASRYRGVGGATMSGAYRLEVTEPAAATAQDRKYLAAQTMLIEAQELAAQFPKTALQAIAAFEQSPSGHAIGGVNSDRRDARQPVAKVSSLL